MRRIQIVALCVALAACTPHVASDDTGVDEDAPLYEGLPAGTIKTGKDLYMVPLQTLDKDGCQAYRQYSPTLMVTMAIYYLDAEGGFTANKLASPCYASGHEKD